MIITPLGTVSPYCKGSKNCPGFLIYSNNQNLLLDCGSGITRLLNMPADLKNLVIIISHLHKDHYSDLSSIGYATYVYKNLGLLKDKVKVYIPKEEVFSQDYEYLMNFREENFLEFITYTHEDIINHQNLKISFSKNPHQVTTHSIKVTDSNKTIVYSSDTGYQNNTLEEFAKNSDLLICEATFLKDQIRKSDNHLYAHEAALIAKKANVKELVLTHFWPEINKAKYVKEAKQYFKNTKAAKEGNPIILN